MTNSSLDWDAELLLRFDAEREQVVRDLLSRVPGERRAHRRSRLRPRHQHASARRALRRGARHRRRHFRADARGRRASGRRAPTSSAPTSTPGAPKRRSISCSPTAPCNGSAITSGCSRKLMGWLAPGGTLAVQMPDNRQEPSHALMRLIAADGPWADRLVPVAKTRAVIATYGDYYRWLRPISASLDIWQTAYIHPLDGLEAIVDWFRGSALRPFLAPLTPTEREAFLDPLPRGLARVLRGRGGRQSAVHLSAAVHAGPQGGLSACASAPTCCWSSAACSRAAPERRRRSPPASSAPTARPSARPRRRSTPDAADRGAAAAHPWASRGGRETRGRARRLRPRSRRPRLPRRRRLDRRLHRRAADARRARRWSRSTSATASSTRGSPPTRACGCSKAATRAALTPPISPSRPQAIVCDVSFISQRLVLPRCCRSPRPARGSRPSSSRSSRWGRRGWSRGGQGRGGAGARRARRCARRRSARLDARSGLIPSPILGGDGAREFLLAARRVTRLRAYRSPRLPKPPLARQPPFLFRLSGGAGAGFCGWRTQIARRPGERRPAAR